MSQNSYYVSKMFYIVLHNLWKKRTFASQLITNMNKNNIPFFLLAVVMTFALSLLASCSSDDSDDSTPVSISVVSCSVTNGAEYSAADLTTITVSYNTEVSVSHQASITLNGTKCHAASSTATAKDVVITLPTLQEGQYYTLDIPTYSIVSKSDGKSTAPAYAVSFTTKGAARIEPVDAASVTKCLGWGWNLGNHFDTSSGQDGVRPQWGYWDGATPTQSLYTNLKKAGVSTVRMGVTWGNYQSNATTWAIDAAYMAEVRQNVEWAEAAGLNVILNMHHDEYWLDIKGAANNSDTNTKIKQRIEKTWTQIAEAFKDKGDFLFFESFNEIQDGGWGWGDNLRDGGKQYRTLNEWNQLVVNTIRATGGNNATRWIGIPGYASNPTYVIDNNFVLPTDPANRLMVSVHFYDPSNFTLSPEDTYGKSEWGHTAAAGKYDAGSNEEHVVDVFKKLQQKYIARNIPVYIGEYGCVMHTTQRSNLFRNYYLEYVCRAAHTYGMPLCIWDNNLTGGGNEHHGYFDHSNGSYINGMENMVKTMIKAATSDDASYTLDTVYAKAPR
jgi:endoglucanase